MPPPCVNHRRPWLHETPTLAAACSVELPAAISRQKLRSTSRDNRTRSIETTPHLEGLQGALEPESRGRAVPAHCWRDRGVGRPQELVRTTSCWVARVIAT